MRDILLITLILFAAAGNAWGQPKAKPLKRKPAAPRAHDKYANQEVSYRQTKGRRAAVFEPNNEPLWAKQRSPGKTMRKRTKNQNIEVENDETHRTRPRAKRTETVNNNEALRRKGRPRRRKN
ncbi:MAG: hypothetical protein U0Y68_26660 [Blastocatellia bacterium]